MWSRTTIHIVWVNPDFHEQVRSLDHAVYFDSLYKVLQGHPEFQVNPNFSEFWGIRVSLDKSTAYWSSTRYEHVQNWHESFKGKDRERKTVIKTNRFEEICNYQVTPFDDGRRNKSSHASQLQIWLWVNGHSSEDSFQWTDLNEPDFWWTRLLLDEPILMKWIYNKHGSMNWNS